jgi:hypothetical protein
VDLTSILVALGGGMWGAAVGAVPAFVFTGVLALAGAVAAFMGAPEFLPIAFGPFFGPHVSFAGGVAAAAWAGRSGAIATGRDIGTPLAGIDRLDVLAVGGVFGVLGQIVLAALVALGMGQWTDPIAVSVVLTAIVVRVGVGRTPLFGSISALAGRFPDDARPWLTWQQRWPAVIGVGIFVGLMGAYLVEAAEMDAGADALAFGVSTTVLIFLLMGRQVPVSHHVALPAAVAALHGAGLFGGVLCGVVGAVIGELASRLLLVHGDTHIDPPAVGIAAVVLLVKVTAFAGWIPGLP